VYEALGYLVYEALKKEISASGGTQFLADTLGVGIFEAVGY